MGEYEDMLEEIVELKAERDRYKAALQKIVDSNLDCPSCASAEVAQKALK